MKGFKNSTRTQSGHGYDEVPTRPATSKDVAAAKAVRIITPGKSTPRVTDSMILGKGEDKAPGERGAKKFAVGGMVPPVASGGMPAQGQPITAKNANDARVRPMPVAPKGPLIANRPSSAGAQAYRARLEASKGVGKGPSYDLTTSYDAKMAASRGSYKDPISGINKLTPKPSAPATPLPTSYDAKMATSRGSPTMDPDVDVGRFAISGPLGATKAYKKGGKVVEKGSGEVYASKAAMKKHEASESKAKERAEHKQEGGELLAGRAQSLRDMTMKPSGRAGYAKGGKSRWS